MRVLINSLVNFLQKGQVMDQKAKDAIVFLSCMARERIAREKNVIDYCNHVIGCVSILPQSEASKVVIEEMQRCKSEYMEGSMGRGAMLTKALLKTVEQNEELLKEALKNVKQEQAQKAENSGVENEKGSVTQSPDGQDRGAKKEVEQQKGQAQEALVDNCKDGKSIGDQSKSIDGQESVTEEAPIDLGQGDEIEEIVSDL